VERDACEELEGHLFGISIILFFHLPLVSIRIVSVCTVERATYTTPRTCSRLHSNMRMGRELGGWVVPLLLEGFDG
jgi:hypothetical protein